MDDKHKRRQSESEPRHEQREVALGPTGATGTERRVTATAGQVDTILLQDTLKCSFHFANVTQADRPQVTHRFSYNYTAQQDMHMNKDTLAKKKPGPLASRGRLKNDGCRKIVLRADRIWQLCAAAHLHRPKQCACWLQPALGGFFLKMAS